MYITNSMSLEPLAKRYKVEIPAQLALLFDEFIDKRLGYRYYFKYTYEHCDPTDIVVGVYRHPLVTHRYIWMFGNIYYMDIRKRFFYSMFIYTNCKHVNFYSYTSK